MTKVLSLSRVVKLWLIAKDVWLSRQLARGLIMLNIKEVH